MTSYFQNTNIKLNSIEKHKKALDIKLKRISYKSSDSDSQNKKNITKNLNLLDIKIKNKLSESNFKSINSIDLSVNILQ